MKFWQILLALVIGATLTAISLQLLASQNPTLTIELFIFYSICGYLFQPSLAKLLRFDLR